MKNAKCGAPRGPGDFLNVFVCFSSSLFLIFFTSKPNSIHYNNTKQKKQILTFEKLKPVNVWHHF